MRPATDNANDLIQSLTLRPNQAARGPRSPRISARSSAVPVLSSPQEVRTDDHHPLSPLTPSATPLTQPAGGPGPAGRGLEVPRNGLPALYNALAVEFGSSPVRPRNDASMSPLTSVTTFWGHLYASDNCLFSQRGPVTDSGRPISCRSATSSRSRVQRARECLEQARPATPATVGIHRQPPAFDQLRARPRMLETHSRSRPSSPRTWVGGNMAWFGGAASADVLIQERSIASRRTRCAPRCCAVSVSAPVRATTSSRR